MAGGELASAAEMAAYDAASARAFGRQVAESRLAPWRTGEPGVMTESEYDDESAMIFGRYSGAREREVRQRVAEARRQLETEQQLLERAGRIGWPATVTMSTGAERTIAESVRQRAGGASTGTAGTAPLAEAGRRTAAGSQRVELREVVGWQPRPAGGR